MRMSQLMALTLFVGLGATVVVGGVVGLITMSPAPIAIGALFTACALIVLCFIDGLRGE